MSFTKTLQILFIILNFSILKSESTTSVVTSIIDSFKSCAVSVVIFSQDSITSLHFKNPIKLSNGTNFASGCKAERRYLHCVTHIFLYPEEVELSGYSHFSLSWVPAVLLRTGFFYAVNGSFSYTSSFVGNFLLQPHYLLIVSKLEPETFFGDLTQYPSNQLSTTFILQINGTTTNEDSSLDMDYEIQKLVYVCKVCLQFENLAVSIPLSGLGFKSENNSNIMQELQNHENRILGSGKNVWIKKSSAKRRFMYQTLLISEVYSAPEPSPFSRTVTSNGRNITQQSSAGGLDFLSVIEQLLIQRLGVWEPQKSLERLSNLGYNTSEHYWSNNKFNERSELAFFPTSYRSTSYQRRVILAHRSSFNFITCDGVIRPRSLENNLDFTVYLRPIDAMTWIMYLFCAFLFSLLISCIVTYYSEGGTGIFRLCAKYFETLLHTSVDNGPGLNLPPSQQINSNSLFYFSPHFVQFIFSCWIIFLLFFNNAYKAELTSKETVPPAVFLKYRKITELLNFTITTPTYPGLYHDNYTGAGTSNMKTSMFGMIVSDLLQEEGTHHIKYKYPQLFSFVNPNAVLNQNQKLSGDRNDTNISSSSGGNNIAFHPSNKKAFLEFLSTCDHTAFIDEDTNINHMLTYLNSASGKDKIFMKGSDDFLSPQMVWEINYYNSVRSGHLAQTLESLTESGIYNLFRTWKYNTYNSRKLQVSKSDVGDGKPIGMNMDIKSLFGIIFMLFVIGGLLCLIECIVVMLFRPGQGYYAKHTFM